MRNEGSGIRDQGSELPAPKSKIQNPKSPPPIRAVLCDFHNTLVAGDAWLHLEIAALPREVIGRLCAAGALPPEAGTEAGRLAADAAYAIVRQEARESGREVDAGTGVQRVLDELGW